MGLVTALPPTHKSARLLWHTSAGDRSSCRDIRDPVAPCAGGLGRPSLRVLDGAFRADCALLRRGAAARCRAAGSTRELLSVWRAGTSNLPIGDWLRCLCGGPGVTSRGGSAMCRGGTLEDGRRHVLVLTVVPSSNGRLPSSIARLWCVRCGPGDGSGGGCGCGSWSLPISVFITGICRHGGAGGSSSDGSSLGESGSFCLVDNNIVPIAIGRGRGKCRIPPRDALAAAGLLGRDRAGGSLGGGGGVQGEHERPWRLLDFPFFGAREI